MPTPEREAEFRAVYVEWSQGCLTQAVAAARLRIGERTFRRYVARFRAQGSRWWRNRPCGHRPSRRAPDGERASLEKLYSGQYSTWNVRHFYERYRSEHGGTRSYTWVKDCLQAAGLVEKRVRDALPESRRGKGERKPVDRNRREGMLLHHIASRHEWATGHTWDLILIMDDATDRVHSGFFVQERGIWSSFRGIREMLDRGLFDCLSLGLALTARLTARETAFGGRARSQLERVMSELDIEMVRSEPSVRMRNARMFGTLLNRLPQELAREGIAKIELANSYLARFWMRFNESLSVNPREPSDAFVALGPQLLAKAIEQVFCLKHKARVCTGNRLLCEGKEMDIARLGCRHLCPGEQYRIHEYEDGRCVLFNGHDRVADFDVNGVA